MEEDSDPELDSTSDLDLDLDSLPDSPLAAAWLAIRRQPLWLLGLAIASQVVNRLFLPSVWPGSTLPTPDPTNSDFLTYLNQLSEARPSVLLVGTAKDVVELVLNIPLSIALTLVTRWALWNQPVSFEGFGERLRDRFRPYFGVAMVSLGLGLPMTVLSRGQFMTGLDGPLRAFTPLLSLGSWAVILATYYLTLRLGFAQLAVILAGYSAREALRSSWELSDSRVGRIFKAYLPIYIGSYVLVGAGSLLGLLSVGDQRLLSSVFHGSLNLWLALTLVLSSSISIVLWRQFIEENEAYDDEGQADDLDSADDSEWEEPEADKPTR